MEGKRTSQLVTISPSAVTAFESDASRLLGWLDLIEVHVKTVSRDTMHEDSDVKDKQQQLQVQYKHELCACLPMSVWLPVCLVSCSFLHTLT